MKLTSCYNVGQELGHRDSPVAMDLVSRLSSCHLPGHQQLQTPALHAHLADVISLGRNTIHYLSQF